MEITILQCICIGIWTAVCMTGMLMGTYLTRCLVMAAGVGVILGDIETGLLMGAVGELAFLGFGVSSGGSVPPNPAGPGIIGAILAITMKGQGMDTEAALAYSLPFAILIQFAITGIYTVATGLVPRAEQAVDQGNYKKFRFFANSTILMFLAAGFLIGFVAASQNQNLERLIGMIPAWLTEGLGTAGKMLPAVGFAVILSVMLTPDIAGFALLGYVLAGYFKCSAITISLIAGAAVWLIMVRKKRKLADRDITEDGKGWGLNGKADSEEMGSEETGSRKTGRVSQKELRRISRGTALKAYFLQNGYNYGNYEGLAYANILYPALKKMCENEGELRQEVKDSMGYCSVNPNFLPILTSFHLVSFNNGISAKETRDIRLALMGPLAGIGDSLVQFCFAPVLSTIGASMAEKGMAAGPVVFLLGMNGLLLGLKLFNEELGFRLSTSLADKMKESLIPISRGARMIGTAIIAGLAVSSVKVKLAPFPYQELFDMVVPGGAAVFLTGLLFYLIKVRKWNMYRLVGVTLAAGILLKMFGILL